MIIDDRDKSSRSGSRPGSATQDRRPVAPTLALPRKQAAKRLVVRVEVERVVSWDHRKLAGQY